MCTKPVVNKKIGRPFKNLDDVNNKARDNLLKAARELFVTLPYEKVSIRKVAALAEVNPALIRYYFINKDGLYQQMLAGISDELKGYLMNSNWSEAKSPVVPIIRAYMKLFNKKPCVTKLVFREMLSENRSTKKKVIEHIVKPNAEFILKLMKFSGADFNKVNHFSLLFNFMSGIVFSYALKDTLDEAELSSIFPDNYDELLEQNIKLIESTYIDMENAK